MLDDFTYELKEVFVEILLMALFVETSFWQFIRSIIISNDARPLPFPSVVGKVGNIMISSQVFRLIYAAAAVANTILHPSAALSAVEKSDVNERRQYIIEEILTAHCPSCHRVFDFWTNCFCVTCTCSANFCGWCMNQLHGTSGQNHVHVQQCTEGNGTYRGTEQEYNTAQNKIKLRKLQEYFPSIASEAVRRELFNATVHLIEQSGIAANEVGNFSGYSSHVNGLRFEYAFAAIKKYFFLEVTTLSPAVQWVEALLYLSLGSDGFTRVCTTDHDIEAAITAKVIEITNNQATVVVDSLRVKCAEKMGISSALLSEIAWSARYDQSVNSLSQIELNSIIPRHFGLRTRFNINTVWNLIEADDRYQALRYLHERRNSLSEQMVNMSVVVFNYIGDLIAACSEIQMTRDLAQQITLGALAVDFPDLGGNRLDQFCEAARIIYEDKVEYYNCKNKEELEENYFFHLSFDGGMPITYFLPDAEDQYIEGSFAHVLYKGSSEDGRSWQALGIIQNQAVDEINKFCTRYGQVDDSSRETVTTRSNAFDFSASDLVCYNERMDLRRYLPLYINPAAVPQLSSDFIALQWQIIRGSSVCGKTFLPTSLPKFAFIEDRKSVFGEWADRFPVTAADVLTPGMQTILEKSIAADPLFQSSVSSFLELLAYELLQRTPDRLPLRFDGVKQLISIRMTDLQEKGLEYLSNPPFVRELKVSQMVELAILFWDGTMVPHATTKMPLALREQVKTELELIAANSALRLYLQQMCEWMRLFGHSKLSVLGATTEAFFSSALQYSFVDDETLPAATIEYWKTTSIANIEMKHFCELFQAVLLYNRSSGGTTTEAADINEAFMVPRTALGNLFNSAAALAPAPEEPIVAKEEGNGNDVATRSRNEVVPPPLSSNATRPRSERGATAADAIDDITTSAPSQTMYWK